MIEECARWSGGKRTDWKRPIADTAASSYASRLLPEILISGMRHRLAHSGLPSLISATLNLNERHKHVRFDFFFSGTSEDVDLDKLEFDVFGQLIGDIWMGVETVGFAAIFDEPSAKAALSDPARLYPS